MSFAQPVWLYLIPIVLVIFGGLLVYGLRKRTALLGQFAAERLLDQLTEEASRIRTWIKAICILIAAGAVAFALARPQLGLEWSERKARGLDIVFIIDSSKSMLATDLRPTRLERAKLAVIDLVERLESDRIGLVAFAGQAFLQTPPTLDYSAFRESLEAVSPGIMTSGGSHLGFALEEAAKAFPSENNVKVAVLLTDGEDLGGRAIAAAEAARESGIQIFAIGIGTPEGEYLRVQNEQGIEEFVRDSSGQPVLSKLDEATLQEIARITGGSYSRLSGDSLDQLYNSVIATLPREERESELQEIRIERFQWAIAAALILLVLDILIRRRRSHGASLTLLTITLLSFTPSESKAQAELTTDARQLFNEAHEALTSGDYAAATELYEASIAAAQDTRLQSNALYNLGHASYQLGLEAYQSGDPNAALEQVKKAESLFNSAKEMNAQIEGIEDDLKRIEEVRQTIEKLLEEQESQDNESQEDPDSENSEENEEQEDQSEKNSEDGSEGDQSQDSEGQENSENESGDENQESDQNQESQQNEQEQEGANSESDNQEGANSEQNSQDGQSGDESENPSDASQPEEGESPEEANEQEGQSASDEESTQDPVDDIPQPEAGEESSEETGDEAQGNAPQPTEGEAGEGETGDAMQGQVIEGMSPEDAAALLDSLRAKETLLPFIDQPRGGRQREIRDW